MTDGSWRIAGETPDLRLFASHVGWLVEALDLQADELLELLAPRFHYDFDLLRSALIVNAPEMQAAEVALCELLRRGVTHLRRDLCWTAEPGREVDWCRTALEAPIRGPAEFATVAWRPRVDPVLMGALASLAIRWRTVLSRLPNATRCEERVLALDRAAGSTSAPPQVWSEAVARRLRTIDPDCARVIQLGINLWAQLRGAHLRRQLEATFRTQSLGEWRPDNVDNLFEWTGSLVVARAAVGEGWKLLPWDGLAVNRGYPDLRLSNGQDVCRISKGRPRDGVGRDLAKAGHAAGDRLSKLIQATGNEATGGQPDIVLTFWRLSDPSRVVTFLADAKRNTEGDGKRYLADSIAKGLVYASAYRDYVYTNPICTLFFYKAVRRVLGVDTTGPRSTWEPDLVEKIGTCAEFPEVLAFDLTHAGPNEDGTSTSLRAWFRRLAADARRGLVS